MSLLNKIRRPNMCERERERERERESITCMCIIFLYKSTRTNPSIIEKVHYFIHFCSKSTHVSPSIILCISIIATVIVHIYTATVTFYFILFYFSLSSLIRFSLFLYSFSPLSSLETNNKSIQIIKFFKSIYY